MWDSSGEHHFRFSPDRLLNLQIGLYLATEQTMYRNWLCPFTKGCGQHLHPSQVKPVELWEILEAQKYGLPVVLAGYRAVHTFLAQWEWFIWEVPTATLRPVLVSVLLVLECWDELSHPVSVDMWDHFYGQRQPYARNGVHFSRPGTSVLAGLINRAVVEFC